MKMYIGNKIKIPYIILWKGAMAIVIDALMSDHQKLCSPPGSSSPLAQEEKKATYIDGSS
jgi:hypothetical protein